MTNTATPIAQDDWDKHWQEYTAAAENNPAQRYRRNIICKLLRRFGCGAGSRILDIGSGQGDLAVDLHAAFPHSQIGGIELSETGVRVAAAKVPTARFLQRDLVQPKGDPGPFAGWAQFAVCSEVLEHLDEPALLLKNASEYLADGCTVLITVPGGSKSQFDLYIGHRMHYTPAKLRRLLESSGFSVELASTAGFPFFNLYRLVVMLRGRRLITDVASTSQSWTASLARAVMALFHPLFALNILGTSLGWQTIAVAKFHRVTKPAAQRSI